MLGVKLTGQLDPITTGNGLGLETFTSSVFRKQRDRVLIFCGTLTLDQGLKNLRLRLQP